MARRIPSIEESNPWMHPVLTLSLLVAWIAASLVILTAMCSSCPPRPSPSKPPSSPRTNDSVSKKTETSAPAAASIGADEREKATADKRREEGEEAITELGGQIHGPIGPTALPVSASKRRLSMSLSMGIPEGLNKIKTMKKERGHGKGGGEESLWKKTIILGEKCKLPNPDQDEDVDENRTGRPSCSRSPRSLPASRTASFANRGEAAAAAAAVAPPPPS